MSARSLRLFSARIDAYTKDETLREIESRIDGNRFTQHAVVNVAKIVNMQHDARLRDAVNECDIVNADGMGVVWGARMLGHAIPERVTGIDLFDSLLGLSATRGFPVFLLGAHPDVVEQAAQVLASRHPGLRIAGFHHGYFWDDEQAVVDRIRASGAKLLFVAITSPRKEVFIDRWRDRLGVSFAMGVGGTFDVVAGRVRRAPHWMQTAGLEWLFRVVQEPRRMWRRYLTTNTRFVLMLMRAKLGLRGTE
ncbi:WecB/TagA/CpsF family glycosyltransferase [Burkholderia ambifaria]|uniref:WecB/TagA/CpsF family glycosyltransferase n=1 Tax=Burkholderia ambifaria TaxID=152480 RepID=UPI001589D416|nr:WecB/TagA/CpsF family glycosyltransferase [Burkholderia ambifaria]MBR8342419.1 WecB/TagA/CpsF family glycosyltransferase [Burkholderia ambifaria]